MKIFIPTYQRPRAIVTHQWIGDAADYTICVHNAEQAVAYRANRTIDPARLVVTGVPISVVHAKQWILDQLQPGEWCMMLDDNIHGFTALYEPWYSREQRVEYDAYGMFGRSSGLWDRAVDFATFLAHVEADIAWAEPRGSHLIGFDVSGNPMFRQRKYSEFSYVCSKAQAVKRSHLNYDPAVWMMDDLDWSAQNLFTFGRSTVNRWLFPTANHYEPGGNGIRSSRMPIHKHDTAYLMERWPGLFRFVSRHGDPAWAALQIKLSTQPAIDRWRRGLGGADGRALEQPAQVSVPRAPLP